MMTDVVLSMTMTRLDAAGDCRDDGMMVKLVTAGGRAFGASVEIAFHASPPCHPLPAYPLYPSIGIRPLLNSYT